MSPIFYEPKFYEPYILSREPHTQDKSPHTGQEPYILSALQSISPIFTRESQILYETYILCALHLIERRLHCMSPIFCRESHIQKTRAHTTQEPYILSALHSIERAIHSKSPTFCAPYIPRESHILYEAYIL